MTALAADRPATTEIGAETYSGERHGTPKAGDVFYKGQLVMYRLDQQVLSPMAASTSSIGAGISTQAFTATATSPTLVLRTGVFHLANAGDITAAHVGKVCYGVDDQTVSISSNSGARSIAGRIFGLDASSNVQVLIDPVLVTSSSI